MIQLIISVNYVINNVKHAKVHQHQNVHLVKLHFLKTIYVLMIVVTHIGLILVIKHVKNVMSHVKHVMKMVLKNVQVVKNQIS